MSEGSPSKLSGIIKKAKSAVGYGKKGAGAGSPKRGGHSHQSSTSSTGPNNSPGFKSNSTEGTDGRSTVPNSSGPNTSDAESPSFTSPAADVTGHQSNYASAESEKEIASDVPGNASSPRTKTTGVVDGRPNSPPERILTAENATPSQFAAAYGYPEIAHDDPNSDFAQRHSSSVAQDLQKYGPGNV